jgi:outer membrane lipoprotein-sorting protein
MNNILSTRQEMTNNNGNSRNHFFPVFAACLFVALFINPILAADMPSLIKKHYRGRDSIYWKIKQITYFPVFEQSETLAVEFYVERPNKLFIRMPDRQIYSDGETTWVYLPDDKQIQKSLNGDFFNPFDLIDSAQTRFQIYSVSLTERQIVMLSIDEIMEPDSLCLRYKQDGSLIMAGYLDANDNEIELVFSKELFGKPIPDDIFIKKLPKDVEVIDLDE